MSKPIARLFYVYDPMCSWCYAFNRSWDALKNSLPDSIEIIYLHGGLAPDTTEPMPDALQKSIQQAWHRIEQTVPQVKFNWDFWSRNTPIRSTYPACRAVLSARKQNDKAVSAMIRAIQQAYYQKALNPSILATLQECAREIGLDMDSFIMDMASPTIEQALQQEILLAHTLGVNSYPSLRLVHQDAVIPIAVDYLDHQAMLGDIARVCGI